jgi:cell division septation protein DedD
MQTSPVNLRNLERIHESSDGSTQRWATLILATTGVAAIVVAVLSLKPGSPQVEPVKKDPLVALAEQVRQQKADHEENEVLAHELDFPDVLSDADSRTTALVAVKDREGHTIVAEQEKPPETTINAEEIPNVPLPAGSELSKTAVSEEPKDELMGLAVAASKISEDQPLAQVGSEGGFMVQVASFKDQDDADEFVVELRKRGHRAFRQAATVPGRGIWHRVRIGSFKTKYEAELYKNKFEEQERTIALVIDPAKVERTQQVRAAKLAERIRKYGSE